MSRIYILQSNATATAASGWRAVTAEPSAQAAGPAGPPSSNPTVSIYHNSTPCGTPPDCPGDDDDGQGSGGGRGGGDDGGDDNDGPPGNNPPDNDPPNDDPP